MKLLFDQNLSRRLVSLLANEFPDSIHVTDVGLDSASDREIWGYAAEHGFIIASKDSDFRQLAFLYGPPPKSVWLRMGNVTTQEILAVLRNRREDIARFEDADEEAFIVLSGND